MTTTMVVADLGGVQVRRWLAGYTGPLGAALDAAGTAFSFGGTDGQAFTVSLSNLPAVRSVLCALDDAGRKAWSDEGTKDALRISRMLNRPIADFDWMACASTVRMVLEPKVEFKRRPSAAAAASVAIARDIAGLWATYPTELRRLANRSVRQDALWRPQQLRGWCLDMVMLRSETLFTWGEKKRLTAENYIDLTEDNDGVLAWVARHGIQIVDRDGVPSLSRDHFDNAVIPDAAQRAWKTFRAARSLKSKLEKLKELTTAERNGRVFSEVIVHHTKTGRGTVRRPGLHNISGALRPLIVAETGYVFVSLDLSRCEPTLAAAMSGDTVMQAALEAGDPYLAMAVEHYGPAAAEDPALRALFKRTLIASLYGQGASSLAAALNVPTEEAKAIRAKLRSSWSVLFAWIDSVNESAKDHAITRTTITGRPLPRIEAGKEYTAVNHTVQGSGADYLYMGIDAVAKVLGREVLALSVHDELILQVKPEDAERAMEVLVECMTFTLPNGGGLLTGEAKYLGASWGK